jgi:hypothetical protein
VKKIRTWKDRQGDLNFAFWQKLGDFIETKAKKSPAPPGLVSPAIDASYHAFMWILKKKYDYWWKKYGLEKTDRAT